MIDPPPPAGAPGPDPTTDPAPDPGRDPLAGVPVVVLGLMAAGKTTVAEGLAQLWGRPLRDSDADLEERTGRTAAELEDEHGADYLHELEAAVLHDALRPARGVTESGSAGGCGAPVVAAAASTIDREDCRRALHDEAVTVWLDGDPGELADRAQEGDHRPDTDDDLRTALRDMDARRRPLFTATAHVIVPVDDDREGLVRRVAAEVAAYARTRGTDGATGGGRSR